MSFLILRHEEKQTGPVPASGVHAELLAEIVVLNTTRPPRRAARIASG